MGEIATGSIRSAMSSTWDVLGKYVVPLGMAVVGFSIFSTINIGAVIDTNVGGSAMVAKYWKPGWGALIAAALFLSIGISLVASDGAGMPGMIKGAIGGLLCGAGLGELGSGMTAVGVVL